MMISQEYPNFMFPISFKKSLKCLISKIVGGVLLEV